MHQIKEINLAAPVRDQSNSAARRTACCGKRIVSLPVVGGVVFVAAPPEFS